VIAILLFAAQILFALIGAPGAPYVWLDFLFPEIPFNTALRVHINLLVVWLIFGFMGSAYYLMPEEVEGEIYSTKLALVQFFLLLASGAIAVTGYLLGWYNVKMWLVRNLVSELPTSIKVTIVIGVFLFIFNMLMTMVKGKKRTSISIVLFVGFAGLALFHLFAFNKPANITVNNYYWWWVVHLWVEGVWKLIMISFLAFLLLKLTCVDREVVKKWFYGIIGLTVLAAIIGTAHHYFWIGTSAFWKKWGGWFSAIELLPFAAMVAFSFKMVSKRTSIHPNRAAVLWTVGAAILSFLGAGVWCFLLILPPVNYYTHGIQINASYGHLAFFGSYAVIVLAMISYAIPNIRKTVSTHQKAEIFAFWTMVISMIFIALSLTGGAQIYLQRLLGIFYMENESRMVLFYGIRFFFGITFAVGLAIYLYDFFTLGKGRVAE
jgi:nitric oxide reductase subunit B